MWRRHCDFVQEYKKTASEVLQPLLYDERRMVGEVVGSGRLSDGGGARTRWTARGATRWTARGAKRRTARGCAKFQIEV